MPSDTNGIASVAEQHVKDNWVGTVHYEGVDADPPADGSAWMRCTVRFGDAFEETMGTDAGSTRTSQIVGVVFLDLFVQGGNGMGDLNVLADTARDLFNMKDIGGVEFGPSSPPVDVPDAKEGWLGVSVRTPFTAYELT